MPRAIPYIKYFVFDIFMAIFKQLLFYMIYQRTKEGNRQINDIAIVALIFQLRETNKCLNLTTVFPDWLLLSLTLLTKCITLGITCFTGLILSLRVQMWVLLEFGYFFLLFFKITAGLIRIQVLFKDGSLSRIYGS